MRDTTHGGKDWTALTYVRQPTATSRYVGDTARCHSPLTVSPWLARVWHGRCSYGTGLGLVSVKLARTFPSATIVSVKRHRADVEPQQALLKLLGIRNCLIAASQLSRDNLRALAAAEDPARFQVIGVDVFEELLSSAASLWYVNRHGWMSASAQERFHTPLLAVTLCHRRFEEFLGLLLSQASSTFLEVPSWSALTQALQLLNDAQPSAQAMDSRPSGGLMPDISLTELASVGDAT